MDIGAYIPMSASYLYDYLEIDYEVRLRSKVSIIDLNVLSTCTTTFLNLTTDQLSFKHSTVEELL